MSEGYFSLLSIFP